VVQGKKESKNENKGGEWEKTPLYKEETFQYYLEKTRSHDTCCKSPELSDAWTINDQDYATFR